MLYFFRTLCDWIIPSWTSAHSYIPLSAYSAQQPFTEALRENKKVDNLSWAEISPEKMSFIAQLKEFVRSRESHTSKLQLKTLAVP